MVKGGNKLARGRIPELGTVIAAGRQDPSTVRTKRRMIETFWMVKGSDQLARGRIPELGGFAPAGRQDPSTVRTELRLEDLILMSKRGKELTRGRTPELGAVIRARRKDPSIVGAKMNSPRRPTRLQERLAWRDRTQRGKGGNEFGRGGIPEPSGAILMDRQDPSAVRTKHPVPDLYHLGTGQGGDQLARGRIPEPGGCVQASR